jgi:phage baseplate assembly protein W
MDIIYYKIPLQLSGLLEGNELPTCGLHDSIAKNLELIIMTKFGEHRNDPTFGCEIWDIDFELIVNENKWAEKLRQSLFKSIITHERRISEVQLTVEITEVEKPRTHKRQAETKKKVDIYLTSVMHKTGEVFGFRKSLFLSPLSSDQ